MKIFLILTTFFVFNSCNALKSLTNGETKIPDEFFDNFINLEDDLIDFWKLDENSGASRVGFNGLNLTEANGAIAQVTGKHGQGVVCNSAAGSAGYNLDYAGSVGNVTEGEGFSIAFWMELTSINTSASIAGSNFAEFDLNVGDYDGSSGTTDMKLFLAGGSPSFDFLNITKHSGFHHYAIVVKKENGGFTVKAYVNGSLYDSQFESSESDLNLSNFGICSYANGSNDLPGHLDSFGVWGRELNQHEVRALYNGNNNLD